MSTSLSLDFKQFYELSDPFATRPLRLTTRGISDWVTSDYARNLFKGIDHPTKPIPLRAFMGGQITDFFWTDLIDMFCISDRVVQLLHTNNITGWTTYPVEIYDRKGEAIPNYHGFAVTGGECRRDRSRSPIITKQAVPGGKPFEVYKALYFHADDWDGSDFFVVRSPTVIVVTEKVYRLFKKSKVKNVILTPLPEVEIDVYLDKFDHRR